MSVFGDGSTGAPPVVPPVENSQTPPVEVPEWAKGIDPTLVAEPSVKIHKDINTLVKSYVHAQKMMGADKVVIPSKESTPEVWNEFYKKVGLPDSFDKYGVQRKPESKVEQALFDTLAKQGYEAGVLPHQLTKLVDSVESYVEQFSKTNSTKATELQTKNLEALQAEWGEAYKVKMQQANKAINTFGNDKVAQALVNAGLNHDPEVIKMFAALGSKLGEGTFQKGSGETQTPQDLQSAINDILKDRNNPYYNPAHPAHTEMKQKVQDMSKKLYQ